MQQIAWLLFKRIYSEKSRSLESMLYQAFIDLIWFSLQITASLILQNCIYQRADEISYFSSKIVLIEFLLYWNYIKIYHCLRQFYFKTNFLKLMANINMYVYSITVEDKSFRDETWQLFFAYNLNSAPFALHESIDNKLEREINRDTLFKKYYRFFRMLIIIYYFVRLVMHLLLIFFTSRL